MMCGIVGGVWSDPALALSRIDLQWMNDTLHRRGPDEQGYHLDRKGPTCAALAHRRLRVIDMESGRQPMSNEDGTVWVTFNGEIYNFRRLRQELIRHGHTFKTTSDTEVLVHLYEEDGDDCVLKLRGMFAFGIWDARRRRLLLARDRMGQKPLVYCEQPRRLLFASQARAILEAPGVDCRLNPQAMNSFLRFQYVPQPDTIYAGIRKLPPAHVAVYDGGTLELRRYWQPDYDVEEELPEEEYRQRLRYLLADATRSQMVSDVPLGAFLSGGIDSTIIVGLMQQACDRPVKTFSIGFPVPRLDDTPHARLAAQHLRTEHREYMIEPEMIAEIPGIVAEFDEPFADSSAIPTYLISQFSREEVTVAVTGDAGDELFAGYQVYQTVRNLERFDRLPAVFKGFMTAGAWKSLLAGANGGLRLRLAKLLDLLTASPDERCAALAPGAFDDRRRRQLLSPAFAELIANHDPAERIVGILNQCTGRDLVSRSTFVHQLTYLPDDLLTKVDVASMAHGLECRSPFLDHHVVEFAARMPVRMKLRRGVGKRILRETFADLLPPQLRNRRKLGFSIPLDDWCRGPWIKTLRDVLLDHSTAERGHFSAPVVEQLISEHQQRRQNHGERLWTLLVLELWHREHFNRRRATVASSIRSSAVARRRP
jgi:asparagine synthase (glutamine-hydrolysing)